jgi:hypothetical protein
MLDQRPSPAKSMAFTWTPASILLSVGQLQNKSSLLARIRRIDYVCARASHRDVGIKRHLLFDLKISGEAKGDEFGHLFARGGQAGGVEQPGKGEKYAWADLPPGDVHRNSDRNIVGAAVYDICQKPDIGRIVHRGQRNYDRRLESDKQGSPDDCIAVYRAARLQGRPFESIALT